MVCGTRPEAIKMALVYLALKERGINVHYLPTGQHAELHNQVVDFFGIERLPERSLARNNETHQVFAQN